MEDNRREITQQELDGLVVAALVEPEKTAAYWHREDKIVDYTVMVPDERAIDNSSFYGYGGSFDREETRQKTVTTFTLNLAMLFDQHRFLPQLFPRDIYANPGQQDVHIKINTQGCPDKQRDLTEGDKQEIKESISTGKYKVTLEKFRALFGANKFTMQEVQVFYDAFKGTRYADIIFKQNSAVDPRRVQQERDQAGRDALHQREARRLNAEEAKRERQVALEAAREREAKKARAKRDDAQKSGYSMDRFVKKK